MSGLQRGSVAVVGAAESDLGQVAQHTSPVDLMAQATLRESEERFSKAFRASLHPIGITAAATGRCVEVNDACLELFGFRREEVIGNTTLTLGIWPNDEDRARLIERLKAGEPVRNMEIALRTKSGALRYFLASCDLAELNGILCLITVGSDITEIRQTQERLTHLANMDVLSGLPNRGRVRQLLGEALRHSTVSN